MDRKPEVLAYLKAQGEASLGEIADHLGVTKQGALRHLDALRLTGLVAVSPALHRGPGRPENRYQLTPAAGELFPHGHRELAQELIEFVGSDALDRFFEERSKRLEAECESRLEGLELPGRLQELARLTTERGHMTEVVEERGRLMLRHHNCPIQDVASQTPYPCLREREMYEHLLGTDVERSSWLGKGDNCCTYDINHTNKTTRGDVNG